MNTAFTYNNYFKYCLSRFPNYAEMSGGLTGGIVYIMVSFFTYTMVHFIPPVHMTNLSLSYLILTVLSAIVIFFVYQKMPSLDNPATAIRHLRFQQPSQPKFSNQQKHVRRFRFLIN